MSSRRRSILLAILGVGPSLAAALSDVPSPENFLRRVSAAATVIGDYVYIEGGELYQLTTGPGDTKRQESGTVNSTLSIDISKSWKSADVAIRTIPKPAPAKSNVGLWTDAAASTFYSWGGMWPGGFNISEPALWKFVADGKGGGTWSLEEPANPTLFGDLHPTEDSAFANTNDTGFAIGGVAHRFSELGRGSTDPIIGIATFDMKTKTWRNATSDFGFSETFIQGSAHYLPSFGPSGVILQLAGYAPPLPSRLNESFGPAHDLHNLSFFDLQTKKRHWQMATGSIPPTPRGRACTAVFPTADGGHDIFMFGGNSGFGASNYQDAYILSLPGFVWTKVQDAPGGPRYQATCVRVGKRQVLSIGGFNAARTDKDGAPQGLLLFDMTALEWKDAYDASAADYERAGSLREWYSNGSLDKVEWSSAEVRSLFSTAGTAGGNGTTNSTSNTESGSTPVGAIAGGVVGGVAVVALVGIVAWLLIRRRRKQHQQQGEPEPDPDPTYEPGHHTEIKDARLLPEAPAAHGYTELPARDPDPKSTYPFSGPVEMDPDGRPREMDHHQHHYQPAPAELDATPGGQRG